MGLEEISSFSSSLSIAVLGLIIFFFVPFCSYSKSFIMSLRFLKVLTWSLSLLLYTYIKLFFLIIGWLSIFSRFFLTNPLNVFSMASFNTLPLISKFPGLSYITFWKCPDYLYFWLNLADFGLLSKSCVYNDSISLVLSFLINPSCPGEFIFSHEYSP